MRAQGVHAPPERRGGNCVVMPQLTEGWEYSDARYPEDQGQKEDDVRKITVTVAGIIATCQDRHQKEAGSRSGVQGSNPGTVTWDCSSLTAQPGACLRCSVWLYFLCKAERGTGSQRWCLNLCKPVFSGEINVVPGENGRSHMHLKGCP